MLRRQLPMPWRFFSSSTCTLICFLLFPNRKLYDSQRYLLSHLIRVTTSTYTFSCTDSDSYDIYFDLTLIYSLYNEGRSQQDCSSSENHIEFSVVMLHCPAESPPFHFPGQQLLLTFIDDLTKILYSCNTSLLFWRNILSVNPVFLNPSAAILILTRFIWSSDQFLLFSFLLSVLSSIQSCWSSSSFFSQSD